MQNNNLYSYTKAKVESLTKNLLVIKRDGRVVKFEGNRKSSTFCFWKKP